MGPDVAACRNGIMRPDFTELHLLGVSFRTAPLAVREALTFGPADVQALLASIRWEMPGTGAMVLSTCNRTEFYLASARGALAAERLLGMLRRLRPGAPVLRDDCARQHLVGAEAARHLFRVAAGLDSAILGDAQILGQVKQMMSAAAGAGTLGGFLHRTVVNAIRVGKRARADSEVGHGNASIGSAVVSVMAAREASRRTTDQIPRALIIGAGDVARDIARHAAKGGVRELTFVNRSLPRAHALAADCGGTAHAWSELPGLLSVHDVVIAATTSPQPVLTREMISAALTGPRGPQLIVDAGVPRNVEPDMPVPVLDIDGIRDLRSGALARRLAAVPVVERMIAESLDDWHLWMARRPVERVLKELYSEAARESCAAAAAFSGGEALGGCPGHLEADLRRGMRQVLRGHARRLRRLPAEELAGTWRAQA